MSSKVCSKADHLSSNILDRKELCGKNHVEKEKKMLKSTRTFQRFKHHSAFALAFNLPSLFCPGTTQTTSGDAASHREWLTCR